MPKFDCTVTVRFDGVEAKDEREALEKCDEAMGGCIFDHPNDDSRVDSETQITERG